MNKEAIKLIKTGAIGVLPTDTIYGIHGLALNKDVVKKIYKVRGRNPKKPFIILIGSIKDLALFDIKLNKKIKALLKKMWPNKLSIIFSCPYKKFFYLHRGTKTLAFRFPKNKELVNLLKRTGPLISTSVNPEGLEPAYTIAEAKNYFGANLDFYIDGGRIQSKSSTLIKLDNQGNIEILRRGDVKINSEKIQTND